jgi:hypothetical protein
MMSFLSRKRRFWFVFDFFKSDKSQVTYLIWVFLGDIQILQRCSLMFSAIAILWRWGASMGRGWVQLTGVDCSISCDSSMSLGGMRKEKVIVMMITDL